MILLAIEDVGIWSVFDVAVLLYVGVGVRLCGAVHTCRSAVVCRAGWGWRRGGFTCDDVGLIISVGLSAWLAVRL